MSNVQQPILEINGLKKYFSQTSNIIESLLSRESNRIRAVDDVSIDLYENQVIGVIGESGCGKTTLLRTIVGLYEPTAGDIFYQGENLSGFDKSAWKEYRRNTQIIFQDPYNTLDPKMTVEESMLEPLHIHNVENKEEKIFETLRDVELDPPERYLSQYPDQLSGGEKQRVSIGRALILDPDIILADEPVSMLDVSTQAAILKLMNRLVNSYNLSMLYISHDLSTVSYICDEINVMYLGRVVEQASTASLVEDPKHPYSKALISAVPIPDPTANRERTELSGSTPELDSEIQGCRFKDRCPERMDICDKTPRFIGHEGHNVACHLFYDHDDLQGSSEQNRSEVMQYE